MTPDLNALKKQLIEAAKAANDLTPARGDEAAIGAAALWDRKKAEYLARGQSEAVAKRNATTYVSWIYGPPPPQPPASLEEGRAGVVRDLGHAMKRSDEVGDRLETVRAQVCAAALTSAEIDAARNELRKLLTLAGYVTRAITRARRDLEVLRTTPVKVE